VYKYIIYCLLLCINIVLIPSSKAQVLINEIMSNNDACILDSEGDSSDWIELYNSSNEPINLNNYLLSDNANNLNKWTFPNISIAAKGTVLIFASGKDLIIDSEIHTNFKLASAGESIYLSNNMGVLVDSLRAISLGDDYSYGRLPDGSSNLVHLDFSSPNNLNNNTSQLVFSSPSGFYSESFNLTVSSFLSDTIYYSTDGSIPGLDSYLLSDSIVIENRSSSPNCFSSIPNTYPGCDYREWINPSETIDKSNVIRCVSYKDGKPSSKVYTQTYFVDTEINAKYDVPVISLVTEEYNFFDMDSGIYVAGTLFDEYSDSPSWTGNACQTGPLWERPIHIEYFNKAGIPEFYQDAGVRIHGGYSRAFSQKSLRLYARSEYGKKNFNYSLLPKTEHNNYKKFILRTPMCAWNDGIITDVFAHNIVNDLDVDKQDYRPVIVFLNGEYWGLHTIRDYIDEKYIEYKHGVNSDSVLLITGTGPIYEAISEIFNEAEDNDLSSTDLFEYLKTQIDIDSYVDYQIAQMFLANYDWPSNNIKMWKHSGENGKWRFVFYDLDGSLKDPLKNMFDHCLNTDESITWPNSPKSTFLFRKMIEIPFFENLFMNRVGEILSDSFSSNNARYSLSKISETYSGNNKIYEQISRWGFPDNYDQWLAAVEEIDQFLELRPCQFAYQAADFFASSQNYTWYQDFCYDDSRFGELIIAPNPNNGNFYIQNISDEVLSGELIISNFNGSIIYSDSNFYCEAYEKKQFNFPNIKNGFYVLSYIGNNHSKTYKFVSVK